jgi:peptide/nickel transport system permease protein
VKFVIRRIGFFIVTLWAAVTFNFMLPRLMPGNPALAMMAQYKGQVNGAALKALEIAFGVNTHESLVSSYFQYLGNIAHARFGDSIVFDMRSVSYEVFQALPWTLGLVGVTTVIAFVLGTLIGLVAGWRRGSKLDSILPPVFVVTSAFPYFWVGLLFVWLLAYKLQWFPESGGYSINDQVALNWHFIGDVVSHSLLPALTLVVTAIGGWILTMRNTVITVLAEDYVRMGRAKGLRPWTVMWGYAGRNAILPNLTGFAMSLGFVVSGAILVEYVFNYPGVGYMLLNAVKSEDYALMEALFLLITVAVLLAILAADVLTAVLDPRTRELR